MARWKRPVDRAEIEAAEKQLRGEQEAVRAAARAVSLPGSERSFRGVIMTGGLPLSIECHDGEVFRHESAELHALLVAALEALGDDPNAEDRAAHEATVIDAERRAREAQLPAARAQWLLFADMRRRSIPQRVPAGQDPMPYLRELLARFDPFIRATVTALQRPRTEAAIRGAKAGAAPQPHRGSIDDVLRVLRAEVGDVADLEARLRRGVDLPVEGWPEFDHGELGTDRVFRIQLLDGSSRKVSWGHIQRRARALKIVSAAPWGGRRVSSRR